MTTRKGRPTDPVEVARKRELSRRLRELMDEKGLGVVEVAKLVERELSGEKFNAVNLSHYRAGRSLPRPKYLKALSKALGVSSQELIPLNQTLDLSDPEVKDVQDPDLPAFRVDDLSDGLAWLQINQRLPWDLVLRILNVLKGEKALVAETRPVEDE